MRYYYIIRGYCYIKNKYRAEKKRIEQIMLRRVRNMLVYDNQRIKKSVAVILGIIDYKLKRFGKCKWNIIQ